MKINFVKIRDVRIPIYSSDGAAALDFFIPYDMPWESKTIFHGESLLIPSGIRLELPDNICLLAVNKSGLGMQGLSIGACLIDSDYRGEIHLNVFNNSHAGVTIQRGEKLVQFIALNYHHLNLIEGELTETIRSNNGFGSTGKF
jgi:dUTP pyrophosphatase